MPCDPRRETGRRAGASPAPPRPPFTEPTDEAFVRADLGPGACAGVNATFSRPQGPSHATLHGVHPCTCGPPGTWGSKAAANFAKSNAARSRGRRGIPRCAPGDSKAPKATVATTERDPQAPGAACCPRGHSRATCLRQLRGLPACTRRQGPQDLGMGLSARCLQDPEGRPVRASTCGLSPWR